MLKRLFTKPVRLDIGAGTLELRSARELDLALSGRTGLSPIRIATLGALPDEALVREQNALQAMEQSIVGTLARAGENGALDRFLRDLDLSLVPDDNDWRSVLAAIRGLDTTHDDYKKAALLKYVAYLTAGKEFVRAIRSNREGAGAGVDARDAGSGDPGLRQRLVFDLDILLGSDPLQQEVPDEFSRMPKGEVLAVDLLAHQALGVILGKNRFTLVAGSPYLLVDDNGNDYRLRPGKNIIGRSQQCDVVVDTVYRAVSRRHLIVETIDGGPSRITDISTIGTFVPRAYIDNRLH